MNGFLISTFCAHIAVAGCGPTMDASTRYFGVHEKVDMVENYSKNEFRRYSPLNDWQLGLLYSGLTGKINLKLRNFSVGASKEQLNLGVNWGF